MDPSQTPQTVAQAVQAATQQAQQAVSHASPPVQLPQALPTSTIDNLTCQWLGCGERTDTAETLYDHVCERHVGRKSTNNLNLTCHWGACRTTTVKRDHITSHIRVHVPLKPHKCDFCGKSFKRPQDLKKHVKTHADDSVLGAGSPAQAQNGRGSMSGSNGMGSNGKGESELAYLLSGLGQAGADHTAANPSYYPSHDSQMNTPYAYQQHMPNNGNGGGYAQANGNGQYAGYGSVSYPNSAAGADLQSMDTRKRAIEALNDFLGDIKRRAINPGAYYDVGQRLGGGNALPLPVNGGYNTGYNTQASGGSFGNLNAASLLDSFNQGNDHLGGGLQGAVAQPGYSLPLPNARTKNDLQDIDRFLEQLQATVYETSTQAQAGMHAQYAGGDYGFANPYQPRSSNSPQNYPNGTQGASSFGVLTVTSMPGMTASTSTIDTPALTPASASSYSSSGHSPMSSHGRASMGSMNGSAMYPSLPSVTGMSDLGAGYPTTTSAPASGLASGFEGLDGRRYSGGRLQRQAPAQDTDMADATDDTGNRTPKASDAKRPKSKGNSSIDPALRGEDAFDNGSTPAARSEGEDKRQEEWVDNIRTIETLRNWVKDRLARGEYEGMDCEAGATKQGADIDDDAALIAKMVEAKMAMAAVASQDIKPESDEVKYPSLMSSA
ncbi:hypothetical protein LTR36_009507 [Oleoguttula mirabilis]|uniref:C2H2-type domain-containing protein n=1 Tax=Oleoguttula mirabilis TaxID=1507867 RepID=A0AAV9JSW9_9PEZI|nr:hypothetical protein LTR36_009507 [Oleoguttula mirabilis]